jgi:hypothetical protein
MRLRGALGAVSAALLIVAVGAGCGSGGGAAVPDPVIDLKALDFGPYNPEPRDMGTPKNDLQARDIEAERLGDSVPLAMDIDPELTYGGNSGSIVFVDPKATLLGNFADVGNFAQDAPNFLGGFISYGSSAQANDGLELINAVMIFPDATQAAGAAVALERRNFGKKPGNQPVWIPKYPTAHAHWQPGTQAIDDWYAIGRLVVLTSFFDQARIWFHHTDLPALVTMVTKSLDAVVPAVARLTPRPVDKLSDQPIDIDGMLGRTLVRPALAHGDWANPPGVYTAHAALNWSTDPVAAQQWMRADGVDLFAEYGDDLYRARDAAGAKDVRDQLGDPANTGRGSSVPGRPAAGELDVRTLNIGNYQVAPIDSTHEYSHSYLEGKTLAAIRLADHMITGLDIDPRLRFGSGAEDVSEDDEWSKILSTPSVNAALQDKAMFAFSSGNMDLQPDPHGDNNPNATLLTLSVIQFPGDDQACKAATDIGEADFNMNPTANRAVSLQKYPEARSYRQPGTPILDTIIAHGYYVVKAYMQVPHGNLDALTSMAEKVYNKQLSLLDSLPPLTPIEVIKQPPDPDGMIRRLLLPDQDWVYDATLLASYGLRGFLQLQWDRGAARKLYQSLPIDRFGVSDAYT